MSKQNKLNTLSSLMDEVGQTALESAGERPTPPRPKLVSIKQPPVNQQNVVRGGELQSIPLEQIGCSPQHRTSFDSQRIRELADNIQANGLIQPIIVRWDELKGLFVVAAGERRYRAAKLLKLSTIPALIRQLTDAEVAEIQLAENLGREDLNPIDQARAFQDVITKTGRTARELAGRLGLNETTVTRALRLLTLPRDIQKEIVDGELSPGVAREIARIKDENMQRSLVEKAKSNGLSAAQTAELVKGILGEKSRPASRSKSNRTAGTKRLTFATDHGIVIVLSQPKATYDDIAEAIKEAGCEVQHRIKNNVTLY